MNVSMTQDKNTEHARKRGPKPRTLTMRQRRSLEAAARQARTADDQAAAARDKLARRIVDIYQDGAGASIREIASAVGLSSARVHELLVREADR
jgi:hypothetical protein